MEVRCLTVGQLLTNCYLLKSKEEIAIIDPGAEAEKILFEVGKMKGKLKYIINTHFHFDHIDADQEIKKITGAQILIHEAEKEFINFKPDKFLKDADEIKIGEDILKVLHTPGHTAGSICLLGKGAIFTGDLLFKDGYGRTDLPGGSQEAIEKSLERISAIGRPRPEADQPLAGASGWRKIKKPGTLVYPGHGPSFTA